MSKLERSGKPDARRAIGIHGESEAAGYLIDKEIYRWTGIGAAARENWISWRSKTRRSSSSKFARAGPAEDSATAVESVDAKKQFQVRSTAEVYLSMNKLHGMRIRFDVIAITLAHSGQEPAAYEIVELRHVEAAF